MKTNNLLPRMAALALPLLLQWQTAKADDSAEFECLMDSAEKIFARLTPAAGTRTIDIPASNPALQGSWHYRTYANDFSVGLRNGSEIYVYQNGVLFPQGDFSNLLEEIVPDRCADADKAIDFSLTLLHINDHHSHLEPDTGANLTFNDVSTRVEMGGFPRVAKLMKQFTAENKNVVKIHAGDAITGTLFYTLFNGEADAALMNDICFDFFALGNHEFDSSDAGLKVFLDHLAGSDSCATEVLAANILPEIGTPLAPNSVTDYLKPSAIKTIDGQQIGFVGIDIASKTQNSSSPLESTQFTDELEAAQKAIDELQAQGVNKIVLITHYQYTNDLQLAADLKGVDVIVGGDSHSLLGDFDQYGLNSAGPYPTRTEDLEGKQVCVVQAWQYANVLGQLHVNFDAEGDVLSCHGIPHLMIGDTFKRRPLEGGDRIELTGADRREVIEIIKSEPKISIVQADASSQALLDIFSAETDELQNEVIGQATEDLCLERIPGQGRSSICDVADTQSHGGDIQQLVADAFLARSFEADISIQNAGGVRIDIPAGDISIGDAYELLPFANTLVNIDLTGAEIKQTLEEAVDFSHDPDGSTGAYPYASGLRWNVDMTQEFGERLSELQVKGINATAWTAIDPEATYTVVVNSFIAGGGDKYETLESVSENPDKVTDTFIDYANAFVEFVRQDLNGVITKPAIQDYSTQVFINADGQQQ